LKAAIYTSFSSDKQRAASTVGERRNCERRATAEGWSIVAHFEDGVVGGRRSDRLAYQGMLPAALAAEFGVHWLSALQYSRTGAG
jgi:site-specific DNA recombinase